MSIEAMKQALAALKLIDEAMPFPVAKHAITTLRTAIEQAEKQEPVAWGREELWVGLTEDEVSEIIHDVIGSNSCWGPEEAFAQAIEAKLKEKNT